MFEELHLFRLKAAAQSKLEKVAYVCGPVDARCILDDFYNQREHTYFGTSYLNQFFGVIERLGAKGIVITNHEGDDYKQETASHSLINLTSGRSAGLAYHWTMLRWSLRTLAILWRERPDAVVLTAAQNYFFMLSPLRLLGTQIVISLHCSLWPMFGRAPRSWRVLRWLNAKLVFRHAVAIQCVSSVIREQVAMLIGGKARAIRVFRPTYGAAQFATVTDVEAVPRVPFRILYVGRIEANKGPFDLLDALSIVRKIAPDLPFTVDFCGEGSDLDALRAAVARSPVADRCIVRGVCSADTLRDRYGKSHVVVVPTRSTFEEGYNKVCAEAVLSGRPIITSAACPALNDLRPAAVEVAVDDIQEYAEAIVRLASDRGLFMQKVLAAKALRALYFEQQAGYAATLYRALQTIAQSKADAGAVPVPA